MTRKHRLIRFAAQVACALLCLMGVAWGSAVMAALPAQSAPSIIPPAQTTVNVALANLRAGPGVEFPLIGSARAGELLQVSACNDDCSWFQIAGDAWIASVLVTPPENTATENAPVATASTPAGVSPTAQSAANLRSGPATTYARVGGVTPGQTLAIVARNADQSWLQLAEGTWIATFLVDNVPADLPVVAAAAPAPVAPAAPAMLVTDGQPSPTLQSQAMVYLRVAQANVRQINGRTAVVPSPIYANGIYVRDAFFTVVGLDDLDVSEQAYRWFEQAQDPASGQIRTAVPFNPADDSLQPQDDESTLLFLIWSGLLQRANRPVNAEVVAKAWSFVQTHVVDGMYVSPPGQFRYWADCWQLDQPATITYNQGMYALATRFLAEAELAGVTPATAAEAAAGYRTRYRADLSFLPLSNAEPGNRIQDTSALLPEFLHRNFFGDSILPDAQVLATLDHLLATAVVYAPSGEPAGIKNIANADGAFASPDNFACATLNSPGDYHNGGYWPMYTLVGLLLGYDIEARTTYRAMVETLIAKEVASGTTHEYWTLAPGRIGEVQPGRSDYSWNVLVVAALRWSGLIE